MAKYEKRFRGDRTQVLDRLDQEFRKSIYTISQSEESQIGMSDVSCVLRVYEAYRLDGSRADITLAMMEQGDELYFSAIVTGGQRALSFLSPARAETALLEIIQNTIEQLS